METEKTVMVDPERFIAIYNKARSDGKDSFLYEGGAEFSTNYAYYLIQYLELKNAIEGEFDDKKIYSLKKQKK